jgi:hypothetical protein
MKKTKNNKSLINLVILLLSSTIAFSQAAYIPPVVTLTYSDGSSKVINLEEIDKIQTIYLPSKYTSCVILRPSSYYLSYRFTDPCISYIKFVN